MAGDMDGTESSMTKEQVAAIELAQKKGLLIARRYPGIADDYRAGKSQLQIALDYGIMDDYGLTERIATNAVAMALYQLIPHDEMDMLNAEHQSARGKRLYEEGRGAFSLDPEQRRDAFMKGLGSLTHEQLSENSRKGASKGGKIGGKLSHEMGVGIHSQTPEERRELSRRGGLTMGVRSRDEGLGIFAMTPEQKTEAGRKGAEASGMTAWTDEEMECLSELCRDPEYQHTRAQYRGNPDYTRVAEELNTRFGKGRTVGSLRNMWGKLKD